MKNRISTWRVIAPALALVLMATPTIQAGFDEGMNHFKAGKYLEAAAEFQTVVDESPTWADGYQLLGICYLKTAKPKQAEDNFLKAIELNGDKFEYHFNLANSYQMQQRWGKVVSTANTASGLADANQKKKLYKLRGFALAAQKKWAEAIDDLEQAKNVKAEPSTLNQLGKAYFTVGENQKAVSALREAAKLDPKNAESHRLMAEALLQLGGRTSSDSQKRSYFADALTEADKALRLQPSSSDARYMVGRAALGAGAYQQSVEALSKVLEQKPNHCNAMANMGKAFMALKDWPNALASLNNATSCSPSMGLAWENKGFVLQKQKKYDDAIAAYEQALRVKPDSAIATKGISTCNQNIEVGLHNEEIANKEKAQEKEALDAQAKYEEELRKKKEWEERNKDD